MAGRTSRSNAMKKEAVIRRVVRAKEQLNKIPTEKFQKKARRPVDGFVDFIREQGVMGLAIGFVLGTQTRVLVDQLVASFINPLLGLVLPGAGTLAERTFSLTFRGQTQDFGYGAFLFQFITFLIIAAVIYFVFKGLRLDKLDKQKN